MSVPAGALAAIGVSVVLVAVAAVTVFGFKLVQDMKAKSRQQDESAPMTSVVSSKPEDGGATSIQQL